MDFSKNAELSTEQQFTLAKYKAITKNLPKKELEDMLILCLKNNLIQENIIKNLFKERIFNEKERIFNDEEIVFNEK